MYLRFVFIAATCLTVSVNAAFAIGIRAHAEIARIAMDTGLAEDVMLPGLASLFEDEDAIRAFYSGCAFPDWGYGGINPDAGEDTHWAPFMEAYVRVLQRRFPPPWDAEARRQVCFFLGVMSHNVSDIPWHFSEEGHPSFLEAGYARDGAGHFEIEFGCDLFLYKERALEPSVNLDAWFPLELLLQVFAEHGREVTYLQLHQGVIRARLMFFGGWMVAAHQYRKQKSAMPWVYQHYVDYYYGGLRHGAAMTTVMARHYFARLQGHGFYQNTPEYAAYVRRDGSYVPRLQVRDATVGSQTFSGQLPTPDRLEVGGSGSARRHGVVRLDLDADASPHNLGTAQLWLYLSNVSEDATPASLTVHTALVDDLLDQGRRLTPDDYDRAPLSVAQLVSPASGWVTLDVTEAARQWRKAPETNHGLVLSVPESGDRTPMLTFYSSTAFKAQSDGLCGGELVALRPAFVLLRDDASPMSAVSN